MANRQTAGDLALALFFYGGIAAGAVLASRAATNGITVNIVPYLFGSILTVTRGGLLLIAVLGGAGLLLIAVLYRALVAVALDEEGARVSGLPVGTLNVVVAGLAGVTIALSMRIVGILLIAALMVLPVTAAGAGAQRRVDIYALDGDRARLGVRRPDHLVLRGPRARGAIVLVAAGAYVVAAATAPSYSPRGNR